MTPEGISGGHVPSEKGIKKYSEEETLQHVQKKTSETSPGRVKNKR